MPSFTPPVYDFSAVEGTPRSHPGFRLFRRYTWSRGYSVRIVDGTATPLPGGINFTQAQINECDDGSGIGGKAFFQGGRTYTITDAEAAILQTAGYTTS